MSGGGGTVLAHSEDYPELSPGMGGGRGSLKGWGREGHRHKLMY